ncbi:MAG: MBL fold metallo-hydrolase [Propionibacteriaceae bacterium]|jgi:glyoxylase-like metal-dependent hydrolase (beta-lactamase superfamily II)|nr:MBL fold metallo-hydrolase [Propionibacteriaceae bacterium]
MRIRPHDYITQATLFAALFPMNCYLVKEDDGLTLVDTTIGLGAPRLARIIQASGKPLRRIALTHVHADHVGGLDGLKAVFPDVQVLVPARSVPFLNGDLAVLVGEDPSPVKGRFVNVATTPDVLLADGDRVGSLRVIASPGHSPDSVSLQDERTGALICGDAFQTRGGLAVSGDSRWVFPFVAAATWSRATALASAKQLLSLQPTALMPGHGDILEQPYSAMKGAISRVSA